jgi:hypothetical protein
MKPFPIKKAKIPLDRFWELPKTRRSAILLLGLFLNEINWLIKLLAKAGQSLPQQLDQSQFTPEEEAAEALAATLISTIVGKIFEGWETLTNRKGTPQSILEKFPLSDETKRLQSDLSDKLSDRIFVQIRNNASFHYPKDINIDNLKAKITAVDSHFFLDPGAAMGFTLSRLSTLALFETLLRPFSSANRTEAINTLIRKVFDTASSYSIFITAAYVDLIRTEFGTLRGESVTIPDAPTIDDKSTLLCFFTHPPDEFPL